MLNQMEAEDRKLLYQYMPLLTYTIMMLQIMLKILWKEEDLPTILFLRLLMIKVAIVPAHYESIPAKLNQLNEINNIK